MRIVMFYHSLLSDWNHGNAHFLRGVAEELVLRGHEVEVFEPHESWSLQNLLYEHGTKPVRLFHAAYPRLRSTRYRLPTLNLEEALQGAGLVLVHEWNAPELIERLGQHHNRRGGYRLFFHDTHHRMASDPQSMARLDLSHYDGVLAYGASLSELYNRSGRVNRAWTWHEAADVRHFYPQPSARQLGELVWIGNWGDGERNAELEEFFLQPVRALGLKTRAYGVRYPSEAREALQRSGVDYRGWLPNFEVPRVFSQHRVTLHIPRRPYCSALPGIPTIRPFEALACGIPLVCSPWEDAEGLFTAGRDYLVAHDSREMIGHLRDLLHDTSLAQDLSAHGLATILARHTCAHRVDELLKLVANLEGFSPAHPDGSRPASPQVQPET